MYNLKHSQIVKFFESLNHFQIPEAFLSEFVPNTIYLRSPKVKFAEPPKTQCDKKHISSTEISTSKKDKLQRLQIKSENQVKENKIIPPRARRVDISPNTDSDKGLKNISPGPGRREGVVAPNSRNKPRTPQQPLRAAKLSPRADRSGTPAKTPPGTTRSVHRVAKQRPKPSADAVSYQLYKKRLLETRNHREETVNQYNNIRTVRPKVKLDPSLKNYNLKQSSNNHKVQCKTKYKAPYVPFITTDTESDSDSEPLQKTVIATKGVTITTDSESSEESEDEVCDLTQSEVVSRVERLRGSQEGKQERKGGLFIRRRRGGEGRVRFAEGDQWSVSLQRIRSAA